MNTLTFPPLSGQHAIVPLRAIDGDSLVFAWLIQDTARLWGMNAPELHGPSKADGLIAKRFLESEMPVGVITQANVRGRDKYGRALIEVMLPDGRLLHQVMCQAGVAWAWDGQGQRPTANG